MPAPTIPDKIVQPFGENAPSTLINPIPLTTGTPGRASYDAGFPQPNFDPVASGGIPPFGGDFNGLFNQITAWLRWQAAGGPIDYDAVFAGNADVGGYPEGAILTRADGGWWLNLTSGNTTDPEAGGAGWQLVGSEQVETVTGGSRTLLTNDSSKNFEVTGNAVFNLPTAADVMNSTNYGFGCRGGTATLTPDASASIAGGPAGQSYTFPDGTGGLLVRDDTGNWSIFYFAGPGTGIYVTANLVLLAGNIYLIDSRGGSFNLTLPAASTSPASIVLQDVGHALNEFPVTLLRNGATIMGLAENCLLDVPGIELNATNDGATTDWRFT